MTRRRLLLYLSIALVCSCTAADYPSLSGCNEPASVTTSLGTAGTGAPSASAAAPAGSAAMPIAGATPITEGPVSPVASAAATPEPQMPQAPAPPMAGATAGASGASAAGTPAVDPSPTPTAGGAAMAGAGGASGAAAAGVGGMPALEPGALQCPNEVCAALPELPPAAATAGFAIENCCAEGGDCGTSVNGGTCNRTADSVPDCPGLSAMGFSVPSCCTAMGQCGIDGSSFMRGCMALEDLAATAGTFIEVPSPKACTPTTM